VEDDDHQRRPERVTSASYPDNISPYDTNPVEDEDPPIKGLQSVPYTAHLVEAAGSSERERCNVLTWAGDLTPNNPDNI
jgi:hypothetical protein